MKTIVLVLVILMFAVCAIAQDQRPVKGLFAAPQADKRLQAGPPLRTLADGLPINLSGDTMYRFNANSFGAGVGIDLASYKGLLILRAEGSQSVEGEGFFGGAGLFINIPALINQIGGAWNASYINPSVGIVPGFDFLNNKYDTGIVLSIIQVNF